MLGRSYVGSINIKSSAFIQTVDFVRESFGEEAAAQLVGDLPKAIRRKIELVRLDAWVEFEAFNQLLQTIADRHYHGDISKVRQSGRLAAEREFPRRFGALSLPAGVSLVDQLNSFAPFWKLIVDRGHIEFKVNDGNVELNVCDFPSATEIYGHRLCGWLEGYLGCLTGKAWRVELHACDPEAASSLVFGVFLDS